jgi:hypothetical protein
MKSEPDMTVELSLDPETDERIRACAAAAGQDVAGFVLQAVAEKLWNDEPQPAVTTADWSKKLSAAIALHPVVTHFVDDSRDAIYAGRGE